MTQTSLRPALAVTRKTSPEAVVAFPANDDLASTISVTNLQLPYIAKCARPAPNRDDLKHILVPLVGTILDVATRGPK